MKTVFILGAGASVAAGAPLMNNFLARAKALHATGVYGKDQDAINEVLTAAYQDLKSIYATSTIDHRNIEELFSAIEIACLINSFGSRRPEDIGKLRDSIVTFIYRTIEETICIPKREKQIGLPKGYDKLAARVRKHIEKNIGTNREPVSFITFNYDTSLEYSLVRSGLGVSYGLPEPFANQSEENYQVKNQVRIPVLKLHGSINWGYCLQCKRIIPTEIDQWRHTTFIDIFGAPEILRLTPASRLATHHHKACGKTLYSLPFIVPPTWNKSTEYEDLRAVWKRAATEISNAENIVVIGYSFPAADTFFKYLFALGSMNSSSAQLENFLVINGAEKPGDARYLETIKRFEGLLGQMNKHGFRSHPMNFEGADGVLNGILPT